MQFAWVLFILAVGVAFGGSFVAFRSEKTIGFYRTQNKSLITELEQLEIRLDDAQRAANHETSLVNNLGMLLSQVINGKLDSVLTELGTKLATEVNPDLSTEKVPSTVEEAEQILRQQDMLPDEN